MCLSRTDPGGPQRCGTDALTRAEAATEQLSVTRYELTEATRRLEEVMQRWEAVGCPNFGDIPVHPEDFDDYYPDQRKRELKYVTRRAVDVARALSLDDTCMDLTTPEYRDAVKRFTAIDRQLREEDTDGQPLSYERYDELNADLEDAAVTIVRTAPDNDLVDQPRAAGDIEQRVAVARKQDLDNAERAYAIAVDVERRHRNHRDKDLRKREQGRVWGTGEDLSVARRLVSYSQKTGAGQQRSQD